jgi:ureidoacrylate peracid hydrolase
LILGRSQQLNGNTLGRSRRVRRSTLSVITTQHKWEQFALLLIDVQRDFWSERTAHAHPDFPANIATLLTVCRREGIDVIHLRASFRADRSDWMPTYLVRGRTPCVEGTAGIEALPFASEHVGETIMHKHTFDGFQNGELEHYLHQRGKRFVLTAGLLTSVCVLLTTASAMQKGFLAAVVEDCCADERTAHQHTLERYTFIFERTPVGSIANRHTEWIAALERLNAIKASFHT